VDGFNEMLGQIQERDVALHSARDELEERKKRIRDSGKPKPGRMGYGGW